MRKLQLTLAMLTLSLMSFAGGNTYHFTLQEPASFNGTALQPGDYKIAVDANKATLKIGKTVVEAPAKLETGDHKYPTTTVSFDDTASRKSITEIHIGGSRTRIVISAGRAAGQ